MQKIYAEQFDLGEGDVINIIEGEERLYRSLLRKHRMEADILINAYKLAEYAGLLEKDFFVSNTASPAE